MNASPRKLWLIYSLGAGLVVCVLASLSSMLLDSERTSNSARAEAEHLHAISLALWRMDSWFAPHLAREAARPFLDYETFSSSGNAWVADSRGSSYNKSRGAQPTHFDFSNASRLTSFQSEYTKLHFQVSTAEGWTSPQAPKGVQRAEALKLGLCAEADLQRSSELLEDLSCRMPPTELNACTVIAEANLGQQTIAALGQNGLLEPYRGQTRYQRPIDQNRIEHNARMLQMNDAAQLSNKFNANLQQVAGGVDEEISVGAMVPIWLQGNAEEEPLLCFVRHVKGPEIDCVQGFLANWPAIEGALLQTAPDLLDHARLQPIFGETVEDHADGQLLTVIPARLSAPFDVASFAVASDRTRLILSMSWVAALLAMAATAFSLRASINYGEKRSRFASTVTHELRTPLTTFRMYSEMLAKDMVPAGRRIEYLQTLERESERLSILVENVLAYSRLEDGRTHLRREKLDVNSLLQDCSGHLLERAVHVGLSLTIRPSEASLSVMSDREAVDQVLFNLVDNACKYGRGDGEKGIDLSVHAEAGYVHLDVKDHGRGIPKGQRRAIFNAFDRGALDPADENPGVGLGLALSRALARDLGGDLRLLETSGGGACFRLSLPRA